MTKVPFDVSSSSCLTAQEMVLVTEAVLESLLMEDIVVSEELPSP